MSELLVNTIKKADGTGSLSVPAESGTVVTTASPSLGRRNLIINGAMQVAQRGTSASSLQNDTLLRIDRFKYVSTGLDQYRQTMSQSTDAPDGFAYSLKLETTTAETSVDAGEFIGIFYYIEGQDLQQLKYGTASAQSVTLSFWAKSSVTGEYAVSIFADDTTSKIIGSTYTINSANTWEYKTITFVGDTAKAIANDNTEGLRPMFFVVAGSDYASTDNTSWQNYTDAALAYGHGANANVTTNGSTWQITGVQLEVGSVATPFEHRSYGEELALCQRYYQVVNAYTPIAAVGAGATNVRAGYSLSVPLRASPTIYIGTFSLIDRDSDTAKSPSGASVWGTYYTNRTSIGIQHTGVSGITDNRPYVIYQSTDAATRFDAEL